MKTGQLKSIGAKPYGLEKTARINPLYTYHKRGGNVYLFEFFACVDCGTVYRKDETHGIQCNGAAITCCPWCRPDSKPWTNGRGN